MEIFVPDLRCFINTVYINVKLQCKIAQRSRSLDCSIPEGMLCDFGCLQDFRELDLARLWNVNFNRISGTEIAG